MIYDLNVPKEVESLINEFLASNLCDKLDNANKAFFTSMIKNRKIVDKNDFNDDTFFMDLVSCSTLQYRYRRVLINFYTFLQQNNYGHYVTLTQSFLGYNGILKRLEEGYRPINYNPIGSIPGESKWALLNDEDVFLFDFDKINNDDKKVWMKNYIWKSHNFGMKQKQQSFLYLVSFLNSVDKNKVLANDILSIKNKLNSKKLKASSIAVILSHIKQLLKYLEASGNLIVDKKLYSLLKTYNSRSDGITEYYTDDELEQIQNKIIEDSLSNTNSEMKNLYKLYSCVTYLLSNTPLRLSSILSLQKDCVINNDGIYQVIYQSKTKNCDKCVVSFDVVSKIEEAIEISSEIHNDTSITYIFMYRQSRGKTLCKVDASDYAKYIKKISVNLNIRPLGPTGIRNKYMNDVTKYIIQNEGTSLELYELTKHSKQVHLDHYTSKEIDDICERLQDVYIGNTDFYEILKEKQQCTNDECETLSGEQHNVSPCLFCESFICLNEEKQYLESVLEMLEAVSSPENEKHRSLLTSYLE